MNVTFKEWNCKTVLGEYPNGRIAILLVDVDNGDDAIATATVNLPDFSDLRENEIIVKDYSENEGMAKALCDAGIVESMIRTYASSGFITTPVMKMSKKFMEEVNG